MKRWLLSLVLMAFAVASFPTIAPASAHAATLPKTAVPALVAPPIPAKATTSCTYTVRMGDWLSAIAALFGTSWPNLYDLNRSVIGDNPNLILPGQSLAICAGLGAKVVPPPPITITPSTSASFSYANTNARLSGEPCQQAAIWPARLYAWETPIGCYGGVYWLDHGDCFGWVRYLHPNIQRMQRHSYPIPGAVAAFYPGTSYGGESGHYAQVIAVRPGWLFISEENMWWRGGGYNRVTYRYLPVAGHNDIVYLW